MNGAHIYKQAFPYQSEGRDHSLRSAPRPLGGTSPGNQELAHKEEKHQHAVLKMILLDKCKITSNYKVNVNECNQIITMVNDLIFTICNDVFIILYVMILSTFLFKIPPPFLIALFIQNRLF